ARRRASAGHGTGTRAARAPKPRGPSARAHADRAWAPMQERSGCGSALARKPHAFLVRIARNRDVLEKGTQFRRAQRLRAVDERACGLGMEIDEHHVGAGYHTLCDDVEDVE